MRPAFWTAAAPCSSTLSNHARRSRPRASLEAAAPHARRASLKGLTTAAAFVPLLLCGTSGAATFVVENGDPPGTGFNDSTPAATVGGNTATTRGGQALAAFQYAADIWGAALDSAVTIRVHAQFAPLSCTATTGIVGSATPNVFLKDSPGAPPGVWHPVALANRLAGVDLLPAAPDIDASFNGAIGTAGCLATSSWYLGLDGQAGNGIDLVTTVLHELAHGLGMTTPADLTTGALFQGAPDVFSQLVYHERTGLGWPAMDDAGRSSSATDYRQLSFAGAEVTAAAATTLAKGVATLTLGSPLGLSPAIALATFGPALPTSPIQSTLAAANDGVGSPGDACEPVAPLTGKVAFVEAGGCFDLNKVLSVQTGGAVAAVLVDDLLAPPPSPITGVDSGGLVTIPSVRISQRDATAIRPSLGSPLTAALWFDAQRAIGTSPAGRVYLNATDPVQLGRSVTHWDPITTPDLLMEPVVRTGHSLDLTLAALHDIGWKPFATPDAGGALDASPPLDACSSPTAACGGAGNDAAANQGGAGGGGTDGGSSQSGAAGAAGTSGTTGTGGAAGAAGSVTTPGTASGSDAGCGCALGRRDAGGRAKNPNQKPNDPRQMPPRFPLSLASALPIFLAIVRRRSRRIDIY